MKKQKKRPPKEEKENRTAVEKMGDVLEVPLYAMTGTPCIEMIGNREFMIESCKGIIEYSQEQIRISAGQYIIKIAGRGMRLVGMRESSLHISGVIISIEFIL